MLQMTTVGMLRKLDVPKGEWIIQTAAGSSVGRMVISVAKHKGVRILSTLIWLKIMLSASGLHKPAL